MPWETRILIESPERHPSAKDIPTVAETVLPGYVAIAWNGFVAPKGTPTDIVARLNAETIRAMAAPEITAKFAALSAVSRPLSPEAFRSFIKDETSKWGEVVRISGAKID
ncbi:MAG: tripartite tricarboxylate transporter substrate binding protein [Enterovirga sp.]|nr:tripartite tricarboxylate transporter substrate binding protein [Enterovirga sp.]